MNPSNALPDLSGPVPGAILLGRPLAYDLAALGYSEEEYFLEGTAHAYDPPGEAPYRTRLVVRRPTALERWNGRVVVEWFNVSGGIDAAPDWDFTHRHLMREGFAWVGVSVQSAGIEGGGLASFSFPLRTMNAERYGSLQHPGDAFAYDIFSQAGRLARSGRLFGGREPERLLAIGESQSAVFLVAYVNHVDVDARVFDGFLVHGRGGMSASLNGEMGPRPPLAEIADLVASGRGESPLLGSDRIRSDLRVPVLTLQSETDVIGLGSVGARQPDAARFRLWEIAGAAHADTYLLVASAEDDGRLAPAALAKLLAPTDSVIGMQVDTPINAGPQQHYVLQAALAHLDRWTAGGAAPPEAPRLALADDGSLALDDEGLATGGLRSPWMDAPTAVLSGFGQSGSEFAFLFGTTRPLDAAARARLYPGGHPDFLERFRAATQAALASGFLLEQDAEEIDALAAAAPW